MKLIPAKVNSGEQWIHDSPVHFGSALGMMWELRWRTAIPLGAPVVPEVYMMSARSPSWSQSIGSGLVSPVSRSCQPAAFRSMTDQFAASRSSAAFTTGRSSLLVMTTVGSAWLSTVASSAAVSRVLVGTATAPALWIAA